MNSRLYQSRPQRVEAIQWTGGNGVAVIAFAGESNCSTQDGELFLLAGKDGAQGWVPVPLGHWVVRSPGDRSDQWPVDPDYFAGKYAEVVPEPREPGYEIDDTAGVEVGNRE